MKSILIRLMATVIAWGVLGMAVGKVEAAPYFFVTGSQEMIAGYSYSYSIYLYTDNQTVTAAQTVLRFDKAQISGMALGTLNSRCSFWAPADPALGYGNQTTPYFYNSEKVVIACGFANPGYVSANSSGDLIAKVTFTTAPTAGSSTNLSFENTLFRYIGAPITPNPGIGLALTIYNSTVSAQLSATPVPSATPVNVKTISADNLNLVNMTGSGSGQNAGSGSNLTLNTLASSADATASNAIASSLNNAIPAPPVLSPRPTVTPMVIPTPDPNTTEDTGEVLSIQSLRELLLPGKSDADQTVVLVNLISTISFIVIFAVLIWRLIMISRMNKLKSKHLKEMLTGELAALESKIAGDVGTGDQKAVASRIEELRERLEKEA